MSDSALKAQVTAAAQQVAADFVAMLKGEAPTAEETALILKATKTLAAAPVLGIVNPNVQEEVAIAKGILLNLAEAHLISGQIAFEAAVTSAIDKFATIGLAILLKL